MPITLRDYQHDTLEAIQTQWERGYYATLANLFTGAGKTVIFVEHCKRYIDMSRQRVLCITPAHLTLKTKFKFYEMYPEVFAKAVKVDGYHMFPALGMEIGSVSEPTGRIIVSSADTLIDRVSEDTEPIRIDDIERTRSGILLANGSRRRYLVSRRVDAILAHGMIDEVINDESHHILADSELTLINRLWGICDALQIPRCKLTGYTATAFREDGKALGNVFQTICISRSAAWGQSNGYLAPLALPIRVEAKIPFGKNKVLNVSNWTDPIITAWIEKAESRPTLGYYDSVSSSIEATTKFRERGIRSAHIDGTQTIDTDGVAYGIDYRETIYAKFLSGEVQVLNNYAVLLEGIDLPPASCMIWARPTENLVLCCLDEKTEILTKEGWKRYNQIRSDEVVANFIPSTGEMLWDYITGYVHRSLENDESFYEYENPHVDFKVTNHHRMLVNTHRTHFERGETHSRGEYKFINCEDLVGVRNMEIPVSGWMTSTGVNLTDDEIRLLGWWMADGTMYGRDGGKKYDTLTISQSEHQPQFEVLENLIRRLGYFYRKIPTFGKTQFKENGKRYKFQIPSDRASRYIPNACKWEHLRPYLDKSLPDIYFDMSEYQLSLFLEGLNYGDGTKRRNLGYTSRSYEIACGQGRDDFANRLQILCITKGWACNLAGHTRWYTTYKGVRIPQIQIKAHIKHQAYRMISGLASDRPVIRESGDRNSWMWCVTVPTGAIVCRRNGKVFFTGNTQALGRVLRLFDGNDKLPAKTDALIIDVVGDDITVLTAGTLSGYKVDPDSREYVKDEDEEMEVTTILDGRELKDVSHGLTESNGVIYSIGKLIRKSGSDWYLNESNGVQTLGISATEALTIVPPFFTLSNHLTRQAEKIEKAISEGDTSLYPIYSRLQKAIELYSNFTLWHSTEKSYPKEWVYFDISLERLMDFAIPYMSEVSNPVSAFVTQNKRWKSQPITKNQIPLLREYCRLSKQKFSDTLTAGEASQQITYHKHFNGIVRQVLTMIYKDLGAYAR